ncbi:hypothetical protein D9757_004249 [Collybiopsis confluens]|uniref:Pheromone-regulated membrane protein 10 n=1 Tax=Collybiopsis confluens TaxID=2823264 RepID=A0A8H5MD05_9AGAR|nr:hypothetical protein D9757_004249 [Collybiopsis confluens]
MTSPSSHSPRTPTGTDSPSLYPLATYGPYPNVYSPFSTHSGPPSPSPFAHGSHLQSQLPSSNGSLYFRSSHDPLQQSASARFKSPEQNPSFSPHSNLPPSKSSPPSSGPVSIMAKRSQETEERDDVGSPQPSSSQTPPISTATDNTDSSSGPTSAGLDLRAMSKSKTPKKGKAVQWLDHHLNSQAAHARSRETEAPQIFRHPELAPVPSGIFADPTVPSSTAVPGLTAVSFLHPSSAQDSKKPHSGLGEGRPLASETKEHPEQNSDVAAKDRGRQIQVHERLNSRREGSSSSPHALDEKGLDPNPFNELTAALERHQSQSSQQNGSGSSPPRLALSTLSGQHMPSSLVPLASTRLAPPPPPASQLRSSGQRIHYFPPRPVSPPGTMTRVGVSPLEINIRDIEVSGVDTPATLSTTAESSPDSMMRSAMLPEGLLSPILGKDFRGEGRRSFKQIWENFRQRGAIRRTHDVPGAVINEGENAGLPSTGRIRAEFENDDNADQGDVHVRSEDVEAYATSQARKIVGAHSKRKGSLFHFGGRTKSRESDVESMHSSQFHATAPGGLLGALLALYNVENNQTFDSVPNSGASTPTRAQKEAAQSRTSESSDVGELEARKSQTGRPTSSILSSGESHSNEFRANAKFKRGIVSTARKFVGLGTRRPTQSRNAGGVFGSLIASTGNISGAAAPASSTLAPNVDRPGFKLTRYGYEEDKVIPEGKLDYIELKDVRHSESLDVDCSAIITVPTGSAPIMLERRPPLPEPISPDLLSTQQHSYLVALAPVSAYIPPPTDYFSPQHGRDEPATTPWDGEHTVRPSHTTRTPSATFSDPLTPGGTSLSSIAKRAKWTGVLKDFPGSPFLAGQKSGKSTAAMTPASSATASDKDDWNAWSEKEGQEERAKKEWAKKEKKKRKRVELFITRHVAQIIQRQEFICKLTRSMMMFGGPGHRLTSQIQATARVLDIELSCMYLPDVMLISFEDPSTGTSLIKFIKQSSVLSLGKLSKGYVIYWKVIHDELSVSNASAALDQLMRRRPTYEWWHLMLIGGACSSAICTVSFSGSFIDSVAVFPLGALLVGIQQLSARNELYSNVFEITIATLFSFLCGCLAATKRICYSATTSSSIVLILPGFIVLSGGLEILSRNIVAGSVRLCYAVVYCLFLAFGLAMGAEAFQKITGSPIPNLSDTSCASSHLADRPWWQQSPSEFWGKRLISPSQLTRKVADRASPAFLTVPLFSLVLSMRNDQPLLSREMLVCVVISCIGWVVTHFVGLKFTNQSDFAPAVGAFAIGMISNVAGRFLNGNAFTIMITGILFQVPSGLGSNGLLVFVSQSTDDAGDVTDAYLSGFQTSLQLVSVAIGLTIGLGIALFLSHPIPSRRRAGGVFSL